jgi:uncharacterized protein
MPMKSLDRFITSPIGVLLYIILLFMIGYFCGYTKKSYGQDIPAPIGFVNDFANVITQADRMAMTEKIKANKDLVEIAVVTVPSLQGYQSSDFAVAIGKKWKVGTSKNNGLVILLAPKERKVFIATGYGIESKLPDAVCKRIIENDMKPYLKNNQFSKGLLVGVEAIIRNIK